MVLETIIAGCKKRQPAYQEQLYRYCFTDMMRVCLRYNQNETDATSCYNMAMFKILDKIDQYKQEGEFMGWVRRIMVNTCFNEIKKKVQFTEVDAPGVENQHITAPGVYSHIGVNEVLQMVQGLPPTMALVFNLYVMEGYTHEQIADTLGIPAGTSKWHLNQARKQLKEQISSVNNNEIKNYAI